MTRCGAGTASDLPPDERGTIFNNLSVLLSDAGDGAAALAAIREAVDTYRGLARGNPARFARDLAQSLSILSIILRRAGDKAGAEAAAREAAALDPRRSGANNAA